MRLAEIVGWWLVASPVVGAFIYTLAVDGLAMATLAWVLVAVMVGVVLLGLWMVAD